MNNGNIHNNSFFFNSCSEATLEALGIDPQIIADNTGFNKEHPDLAQDNLNFQRDLNSEAHLPEEVKSSQFNINSTKMDQVNRFQDPYRSSSGDEIPRDELGGSYSDNSSSHKRLSLIPEDRDRSFEENTVQRDESDVGSQIEAIKERISEITREKEKLSGKVKRRPSMGVRVLTNQINQEDSASDRENIMPD